MLKIRRPLGRLIFNMGIAIPGKTVFLIETAPRVPKARTNGREKWSHRYFGMYLLAPAPGTLTYESSKHKKQNMITVNICSMQIKYICTRYEEWFNYMLRSFGTFKCLLMIRRFSYWGIRRNEYVWKETVTTHCCDVNGICDNSEYNSHSTLYIGFGGMM